MQPAHRLELGLVVVGDVDAAPVRPGIEHRAHAVVPFEPGLAVEPAVRRPLKIGGIDVGGEPFLVTVELIGTDEVHLAGKAGPVSGGAQIVVERRDRRGELDRVVERADPGGQASAQHGKPRRRTERKIAIRVLEHDSLFGEAVEMRRLYQRMSIGRERLGRELVGHDEEKVRALRHGRNSFGIGPIDAVAKRRCLSRDDMPGPPARRSGSGFDPVRHFGEDRRIPYPGTYRCFAGFSGLWRTGAATPGLTTNGSPIC